MDNITKWICEWLIDHYRKNTRYDFSRNSLGKPFAWVTSNQYRDHIIIIAGDAGYEFSIKFKHTQFFTNGKRTL